MWKLFQKWSPFTRLNFRTVVDQCLLHAPISPLFLSRNIYSGCPVPIPTAVHRGQDMCLFSFTDLQIERNCT